MTGDAVRQRLAGISARAEAATEGPWEALPQFSDYELVGSDRSTVCRLDSTTETVEFIAAARSDVPRLVAALTAVLDLAAKYRHGALRWADPLPVPEWVDRVEAAVAAALEEQP